MDQKQPSKGKPITRAVNLPVSEPGILLVKSCHGFDLDGIKIMKVAVFPETKIEQKFFGKFGFWISKKIKKEIYSEKPSVDEVRNT